MFLLGSGLAWFVGHLAENYTSDAIFKVEYGHTPDSLLLKSVSKKNINVRLQASGFQLLLFGISPKSVYVDLSSLETNGTKYYVSPNAYRGQIRDQMSKFIHILEMDRDTMFFQFQKLYKKKLAVISNAEIGLEQYYLLDKNLKLLPDSIVAIGPKDEISGLDHIETIKTSFFPTGPNFSEELQLQLPTDLKNTTFSDRTVRIVGEKFKFSERIVQVPIKVVNVPKDMEVRTFPETASIICRDRLEALKGLKETDFEVSADYAKRTENGDNILKLELTKKMDLINVVQLKDDKVEFILMKS